MILSTHPRLAGALAGLGAWVVVLALIAVAPPLDEVDRDLSARVLGASGAYDIHGEGTYTKPRYRLNLVRPAAPPAPTGVLIADDDPEGIFQANPPSPSDEAVIFSKLRKRGLHHVAVVTPLGWDEPDPASLLAMRMQMDLMDSVVLGLPLSYGAVSEPVAPAFMRLSIPVNQVQGDITALPVVNRISIPSAETGGEKTAAGFTDLLNEKPEPGSAALLAKWGDRIVFSMPLAAEIARKGLDLRKIRIELGKSILLGQGDLWVEIDGRGRIATPKLRTPPARMAAPVSALIGGETPERFTRNVAPLWIQDGRLTVPQEELQRQERQATADLAIRSSAVSGEPLVFPRPDSLLELAGIGAFALLCGAVFGRTWKWLVLPLAAGGVVGTFFGLIWLAQTCGLLPLPLATLAVPAAAGIMRMFLKTGARLPASAVAVVEAPAGEAVQIAPSPLEDEPASAEKHPARVPVEPAIPEVSPAPELATFEPVEEPLAAEPEPEPVAEKPVSPVPPAAAVKKSVPPVSPAAKSPPQKQAKKQPRKSPPKKKRR